MMNDTNGPTRRGLLGLLGAALAAPAIIRTPGLLMPIKPPHQVAPPLIFALDFPYEYYVIQDGKLAWLRISQVEVVRHYPTLLV